MHIMIPFPHLQKYLYEPYKYTMCRSALNVGASQLTRWLLGLMAVCMGIYVVAWQQGNKRGQRKEQERIESLRASGFLKEKQEGEEPEPVTSYDEIM